MNKKIEFTEEDFLDLYPEKTIQIGRHQVTIQALSFKELTRAVTRQIPLILDLFREEIAKMVEAGETELSFGIPEVVEKIKESINNIDFYITKAGSTLLADLTKVLRAEDIQRFDPGTVAEIINTLLTVNEKSLETLEKNLPSLTDLILRFVEMKKRVNLK